MNIVVTKENMSLLDQTCQGYFLLMMAENVVGKGNMRLLGQTHQFNIFFFHLREIIILLSIT